MSDSEDGNHIDDEINPTAHKKLLESIGRLGKNQHIRKPTRSEPSLSRSEFHLVKPQVKTYKDTKVSLGDLVKELKKTSKHIEVGRQLKNTQHSKKVLKKPLERPVADRIQRSVAYEKAKKSLSRWDAVVERDRVSEHQVFPLDYAEIHVQTVAPKKPKAPSIKSDLMIEMEKVEAKLRALKGSQPENGQDDELQLNKKLTRDELVSRRKELAYLRVRESQKSAKARLQNKIKSKKFHKYLKREKLKEQIKEFELLQKTNPEAALEKLEDLEKNRVQERASLRHKNTGTWAKNLQIRAKYDKDVRKDLAEQLALSRELTEKKENNEDDNSEEEDEEEKESAENYDPFNPWVKGKKSVEQSDEVTNFVSGYRKYWTERNKNEKALNDYRRADDDKNSECEDTLQEIKSKDENGDAASDGELSDRELIKFKQILKSGSKKLKKKPKQTKSLDDSGWTIEDVLNDTSDRNLDDIFDNAEDTMQKKIASKIAALKKELNPKKNAKKGKNKKTNQKSDSRDLSFKKEAKRPDIDEELLETPADVASAEIKQNPYRLTDADTSSTLTAENKIDTTNFASIKPKSLQTALPDMVNSEEFFDDETDRHQAQMTIAEAFEDDDIVADFERDRDDERKKSSNDDIDLTLPGWGSWAGCGISKEKQTKRLILKFAKDAPRRDDNKGNVYINEGVNEKLKKHLVSDLPFPFKSVKDYEASIRAPIGRSFVPETAFRMLTRPAVVTKLGAIIEPMDSEVLIKAPKRPRSIVDRRIEKLNKNRKR